MRTPACRLLVALACTATLLSPVRADELPDPASGPYADLIIVLSIDGNAYVQLSMPDATPVDSAAVTRALRNALGPDALDIEEDRADHLLIWETDEWPQLLEADDGRVRGRMDLSPLLAALGPQGVNALRVRVMHPQGLSSRCSLGQPQNLYGLVIYQRTVPVSLERLELDVDFDTGGMTGPLLTPGPPTPGDPAWLALLLVVPVWAVLAGLRVRRLAARPDVETTTLGFRTWRFLSLLLIGTWVAWMAAVAVSGAATHVGIWLAGPGTAVRAARWALLYLLPPLAIARLARTIAAPAERRLQEQDWPLTDLTRQAVSLQVLSFVVVLLLWLGLAALVQDHAKRTGVVLMLAAVAVQIAYGRLARQALQMTPVPLTHGELRDRVADLAAAFGVAAPQVGLLPTDRTRLVNAFALRGRGVWLTDRLVREFSRREVDAVVAHELAHLRQFAGKRRVRNSTPAKVFLYLAALAVAVPVVWQLSGPFPGVDVHAGGAWPPIDWPPLGLASLSVALLLATNDLSRRREFDADRQAVATTGDVPGLITALLRLNRLSGLPVTWGRWEGLFLTHPPTARRVAALARQGGLSAEQVAGLTTPDEPDPDRYPIPPTALAGGTVFSPEFRRRILGRLSWVVLADVVLLPVLAAGLVEAAGPGRLADGLLLAGAVTPTAVYLVIANTLAPAGSRGLCRGLRDKLAAEGIDVSGAEYVSLAPTAVPLLYEGFGQWDVGFLWLDGDRLVYVGEQTRFALVRPQVVDVRLGRGLPGWLPTRRVLVTWRDPDTGAGGTVALWPGAPGTLLRLRRAAAQLAGRLNDWRDGRAVAESLSAPTGLGPPALGTVHGESPRQALWSKAWLGSLLLFELLAVGLCVLAGVPFAASLRHGTGYVLAVVAGSLALQALPYWLAPAPPRLPPADRRPARPPVLASSETGPV
jgi:Zn-dependent protease with chaperone function